MILEDDHYCFACGMDNPNGLRVDWKVDGKITTGTFVARREHQGWKGVVHGGILATLLDEAMTRLAWIACGGALTAEMSVRFLKPGQVGEKLHVLGEIVSEGKKLVEMRAYIYVDDPAHPSPRVRGDSSRLPPGKILIARSEGKAVKIKPHAG